MDGAGDGGAADLVQRGEGGVRELVAQVNEGDDDAVGEGKVVVRAGAGRALAVVTSAIAQPGVFPGRPGSGEFGDELAESRGCRPVKIRLLKAVRAHPDDTSRSFRAAAHVHGTDTPQSPATPRSLIAHQVVSQE